MNFIDLQSVVRDLIAAHATFSADAASTVFADVGNVKPLVEEALQVKGYAVTVWPPIRGNVTQDDGPAGIVPIESIIVVRLEVLPQKLAGQDDPSAYLNGLVRDIIGAVLSAPEEIGGVRFGVPPDAFDLMNFDEGLIAYHLRFKRLAVFG